MNPSNYGWTNTSKWSNKPGSSTNNNASHNSNINPTQSENRKDMITRLFRTILGREPDDAALNYYLFNSNISEFDIAKDMYESVEHQEIIKKAIDVIQMIQHTESITNQMNQLQFTLNSQQELIESYKALLSQPKYQTDVQYLDQNDQYQDQASNNYEQQYYDSNDNNIRDNNNYESTMLLEDPFEGDDHKGFFSRLKSWFKF